MNFPKKKLFLLRKNINKTLNTMKIPKIFIILIFVTSGLIHSSCSKDDDDNNTNPENNMSASIEDSIKESNWQITYFWDSDKDETYHFNEYIFTFNEDNTIIANNSKTQVSGTWSMLYNDRYDKLLLDFGTMQPFEELNDDWHIKEWSDIKIKLEDVSRGNGNTDYLTFEAK